MEDGWKYCVRWYFWTERFAIISDYFLRFRDATMLVDFLNGPGVNVGEFECDVLHVNI